MAFTNIHIASLLSFLAINVYLSFADQKLVTYIVHVQPNPASPPFSSSVDRENWYKSFLPTTTTGSSEPSQLIHCYHNVVSGFAARLTEDELGEIKNKDGFIHAYPERTYSLATTHTPQFLGLNPASGSGFWNRSNFGRGVIIGVLDSGISPHHPSFSGTGMPPPPTKWKGICEFNASDCNNKLIGARNLVRSSLTGPWDLLGHGTHTASTAGGAFVKNANVDGQAFGTAVGMAPSAHIAIYRVCDDDGGCLGADMLAGMDKAVEDGVDILSMSIGGPSVPFYNDSIAIGSFGAIEKGVFVSCAANNNGPTPSSLANEAPWILTVGASTIDREVRTTVQLGSKASFNGQSAYQPRGHSTTLKTLMYPGLIASNASFCENGTLNGIDVRGKVVLCDDGNVDWVTKGAIVKAAGGAGMIIANMLTEGASTTSYAHVLPASHVSFSDGRAIKAYISSTPVPKASILFKGTLIGTSPAPVVAYFSSRGPSKADPTILKPDIIGPGANILAAWPFLVGPSGAGTMFNFDSGTSMATPHLSGIAALLKSAHPSWSPAAIRSAMMTTADITANDGKPILDENLNTANFFDIGAGHVNPTSADKPGLIYDMSSNSYIGYICGLQYTDAQVSTIARRRIKCSSMKSISGSELNYPSFTVLLSSTNNYTLSVSRTVKNVGAPNSTYALQVTAPLGVSVAVNRQSLSFTKVNQTATFSVEFTGSGFNRTSTVYFEGYLTWVSSDNSTFVRSPLMVGVN